MPCPEHDNQRPTDVTKFWILGHCGLPTTQDETEQCGFCGEMYHDCSLNNTRSIKEKGQEDCGGGFWCHGCNRFWANDTCGNYMGDSKVACDGAELVWAENTGNFVYCCCGQKLFYWDPDQGQYPCKNPEYESEEDE